MDSSSAKGQTVRNANMFFSVLRDSIERWPKQDVIRTYTLNTVLQYLDILKKWADRAGGDNLVRNYKLNAARKTALRISKFY